MFIIKTQYKFFVVILILLAIIYLIKIKNDELNQDIKNENTTNLSNKSVESKILSENNEKKNKKSTVEKNIKLLYELSIVNKILILITLILVFIGFFIYLGQKKYEYKNKFSYITFLFGSYKCKNTIDNDLPISKSIQYIFTT